MPLVDPAASRLFRERFGPEPAVVARAPGRVNLIGDHTDYSGGFVLPMAIEQEITVAIRPLSQPTVQLASEQFGSGAFRTDQNDRASGWGVYVQGVLRELGFNDGLQVAVSSTIPAGAGLSSSAALEIGVARAVTALTKSPWDVRAASLSAQRAENDWVGMQCGIMDQLSSAAGSAGHALLIDCESLDIEHVPLPESVEVVILDTRSERQLVGSEYNDRRTESEAAAAQLGVTSLRQASLDDIEQLDGLLRRRAHHVVTENQRVLDMAEALRSNSLGSVGDIMATSHHSMRDDYETSAPAVDAMVEAATGIAGLIGVRLTGGGFGGCCVAIVERGSSRDFSDLTLDRYRQATGITGRAYVTEPADGAELLEAP